jgi:hypothetical protein
MFSQSLLSIISINKYTSFTVFEERKDNHYPQNIKPDFKIPVSWSNLRYVHRNY